MSFFIPARKAVDARREVVYSRTLCQYYINTVQYITYSVNTVHYITEVYYLVLKYCALLTSVDSTDILCITDISRQ